MPEQPPFATGGAVEGNPSFALPDTGCHAFLPRHSREHNERVASILDQVQASTPTASRGYRRHALRHVVLGIRYRYPVCCVARFVAVCLLRPNALQAIERGVVRHPNGSVHVPCGLRHHGVPMGQPSA